MASTPTSPATDLEAHYASLQGLGPEILLAFKAGDAKTEAQRELETHAIRMMGQLRKNAPPKKQGGKNKDIMGVKARIDEVFQNDPAHDAWVAGHWRSSGFSVERQTKRVRTEQRRNNETPSKKPMRNNASPSNSQGITKATTPGSRTSPRKKPLEGVSVLTATPTFPATAAALATEAPFSKMSHDAKFRLAHVNTGSPP